MNAKWAWGVHGMSELPPKTSQREGFISRGTWEAEPEHRCRLTHIIGYLLNVLCIIRFWVLSSTTKYTGPRKASGKDSELNQRLRGLIFSHDVLVPCDITKRHCCEMHWISYDILQDICNQRCQLQGSQGYLAIYRGIYRKISPDIEGWKYPGYLEIILCDKR